MEGRLPGSVRLARAPPGPSPGSRRLPGVPAPPRVPAPLAVGGHYLRQMVICALITASNNHLYNSTARVPCPLGEADTSGWRNWPLGCGVGGVHRGGRGVFLGGWVGTVVSAATESHTNQCACVDGCEVDMCTGQGVSSLCSAVPPCRLCQCVLSPPNPLLFPPPTHTCRPVYLSLQTNSI